MYSMRQPSDNEAVSEVACSRLTCSLGTSPSVQLHAVTVVEHLGRGVFPVLTATKPWQWCCCAVVAGS